MKKTILRLALCFLGFLLFANHALGQTCDAVAPVVSNDGGDCGAGDTNGDMNNTPFVFMEDGTSNTTAPFFTEYIVTGALGTIIGVFGNLSDAEAAANAEATANSEACIQAINHEGTANIVNDFEAQTNGLFCAILTTCPFNDLASLYGAMTSTGDVFTVADLTTILGPPNAGGVYDLGPLSGLPPGLLLVAVPPFCYELGAENCITVATCPVIAGCTDSCSPNYDATATMDDGSCQPQLLGCTNPAAPEYDANALCDDGTCSITSLDIPTLSEWGLITLALLLMTFGSVKMAVGSTSMAGAGSTSIPVSGGNNFNLPFNANLFCKTSIFTGILAFVGFAICAAIFRAIFLPDVIGIAIAGPVFAYLLHLLILLEKNHKS